jgi:hypothetical protein
MGYHGTKRHVKRKTHIFEGLELVGGSWTRTMGWGCENKYKTWKGCGQIRKGCLNHEQRSAKAAMIFSQPAQTDSKFAILPQWMRAKGTAA